MTARLKGRRRQALAVITAVSQWARRQHDVAALALVGSYAYGRPSHASITTIELALDTAHGARIAPVWAALLTGSAAARGRGTIGDDVRDATGRCSSRCRVAFSPMTFDTTEVRGAVSHVTGRRVVSSR